jgi:hypothetical protein
MRRCTVTSSALVGSSAMISAGRSAMAMAISTRWRMPPDSSCGYWRAQGGLGQAHAGQQVDHARLDGGAVAQAVNAQDFADLVAHGAHGVERGGRVLGHQAEHAAANAVPARGAPVRDLGALQPDAALLAAPVVGEQADHGLGRGGLARARFADQGHDLAGRHGKRQAVDHALLLAAVVAVGDDQVLDFEQRGGGCGRDCRGGAVLQQGAHAGLRAKEAPMRLAASTTATTTRPGAVVSHQAVAM